MSAVSKTELIIALDYPSADSALRLVEQMTDLSVIYKVGFELFMAEGPDFVRELIQKHKKRVFLDLKFYDIPNTVQNAVKQACELHVDFLTLHLMGGESMARVAVAEAKAVTHAHHTKLLGVSVLTSFREPEWTDVVNAVSSGFARTVNKQSIGASVEGLVSRAENWGVDGVVCSAHELEMVRQVAPRLFLVVPGIRLAETDTQDQARVMTPEEAAKLGAGAIVMGRPITGAREPRKVVEWVLGRLCQ